MRSRNAARAANKNANTCFLVFLFFKNRISTENTLRGWWRKEIQMRRVKRKKQKKKHEKRHHCASTRFRNIKEKNKKRKKSKIKHKTRPACTMVCGALSSKRHHQTCTSRRKQEDNSIEEASQYQAEQGTAIWVKCACTITIDARITNRQTRSFFFHVASGTRWRIQMTIAPINRYSGHLDCTAIFVQFFNDRFFFFFNWYQV